MCCRPIRPICQASSSTTSYEADRTVGLTYDDEKQLPARGVVVELRDAADNVIERTNTTDGGYYSFVAPHNSVVTIAVKAALGDPKQPHVAVYNTAPTACPATDLLCYVYTARVSVPLGASPVTKDITLQSGWDNSARRYSGTREAAPFAIIDTIHDAEKFVRASVGNITLPPLIVYWSPANNLGDTAYSRVTGTNTGSILLNGSEDHDTDEYDDGVILHEWAHYLHAVISRSDSPGSTHEDGDILDPAAAFSEGFATAFAGIVLKWLGKDPLYVDTAGAHQGGGSWYRRGGRSHG